MKKTKEFLLINLGLFLVAIGIHFFKVPNNFATGGVSGLAIILNHFFHNLSISPLMLIINIVLLMAGVILIGFHFGTITIYSSFALSGMVWILDTLFPISASLTGDTLLELIYSIIFPAVGSAIVFNQNASTGGTDIVAKILNKLTNINIGVCLLIVDTFITIAAGFVFGVKIGLYSFLGLLMKGFMIDIVIESFNLRKQMVIISQEYNQIKTFITQQLNRSASIHTARGAFTNEEKHVITTVLSRSQAIALRKFIKAKDEKAFITITSTSEIIGKGFRSI